MKCRYTHLKQLVAIVSLIAFLFQGCAATGGTGTGTNSSISTQQQQPVFACQSRQGPKPTIAAVGFEVKVEGATKHVGDGVNEMLTNALVETQCFRVVDRSMLDKIYAEQGMTFEGGMDVATAVNVGSMLGAQYLITGTITEFKENESGGGVGAFVGALAGLAVVESHIGFVLKIVSASTGEIVASKSINKKVQKVGLIAGGGGKGAGVGTLFFKSQSMQDALEQAINEAIVLIADRVQAPADQMLATATSPKTTYTPPTAETSAMDCPLLTSGNAPRIMVVIPEQHLERKIPDPAGETEIIRQFVEKGFTVVDQAQINAIRQQEKVLNAIKDPQAAAALGVEFGADIIIVGEAFSQRTEQTGTRKNMISCRARVEARAIQTSTARILAANGLHGAGLDIAEMVSAKAALREAGSQMAQYFIGQLCQSVSPNVAAAPSRIEILLTNVKYQQTRGFVQFLETLAGVHDVQKTQTGDTARLQAQFTGTAEELADMLLDRGFGGFAMEISNVAANKLNLIMLAETPPLPKTSSVQVENTVEQIQNILTQLGYDPGPVDGVMGKKTENAIKTFQHDSGLPVDGKPSVLLLELMKTKL